LNFQLFHSEWRQRGHSEPRLPFGSPADGRDVSSSLTASAPPSAWHTFRKGRVASRNSQVHGGCARPAH